MIVVLGLFVLIAAAVVALAGIFTNTGAAHDLTSNFTVFGHQLTGSTGTLFLFGIIVGAAAMLGLGLLLAGARRTSRRGATARHGLRDSRRETDAATKDRDTAVEERDAARVEATAAADDRDSLSRERDSLTDQRDALTEQRNVLTEQRDDLLDGGPHRAHEQTAGTRTGPMRQQEAVPLGAGEASPANGHRRPHLLGRDGDSG
ncbi:hypothetical protein AB0K51_12860 [Kitasatospora sp. NPDC049285]|uniref:hypothetical protein n=1 Tax=Kitasatospora sp. NPDC049285 TaxID=3157096 RepID=UPI003440187F